MDFHRVCSISLVRGGKNSKRHINLALDFRQALIQGFPLIGVKKSSYLTSSIACNGCYIANFYTFRRPDVKMTEKHAGVNRKICVKSEE